MSEQARLTRSERMERWLFWAALGLVALFSAHHVLVALRESVNWDEFALYSRVHDVVDTNIFRSGGRPGLVTLMLVPFLSACEDILTTALQARALWLVFSLGYPLAFFFLLLGFFRRRSGPGGTGRAPHLDALLGVLLLVLVPLWQRWSVQVRTDQAALFFVLWSGVAAMASERRLSWAGASGLLAALGLLCTQKAAYTGALVGVLVVFHGLMGDGAQLRRDGRRLTAFVVALVAVWLAFQGLVAFGFERAQSYTLGGQFDSMAHYGSVLNYALYSYVVQDMIPHALLGLGLLGATVLSVRRKVAGTMEVLAAWILLALGIGIAWFHQACFAYFWMTIGLFPAAVAAIALGPIREAIALDGTKLPLVPLGHLGSWLLLVSQSVPTGIDVLNDTLGRQRESLSYVDRNFDRDAHGFHVEGALTCRSPKDQFPAYFSIHILRQFYGENAETEIDEFLSEFREKPVEFILPSVRMSHFPVPIQTFWNEHYVHYKAGVLVPGISLKSGQTGVDIIVPGDYRWRPPEGERAVLVIENENEEIAPGGLVHLDQGSVPLSTTGRGILHLAQKEEPEPGSRYFYSEGSLLELHPIRRPSAY